MNKKSEHQSVVVTSVRSDLCINGRWNFKSEAESEWTTIQVPGTYAGVRKSWGAEQWDCFDYPENWEGKGAVYRRTVTLPESFTGMDVHFFCGACAHHTEVFVNSNKVGEWHDGYTPMEFSITPALQDGENTIEVRISGAKNDLFDDYGTHRRGIWQDCYLRAIPFVSVENHLFIQTLTSEACVVCEIPVTNQSDTDRALTVECIVTELDGTIVHRFASLPDTVVANGRTMFTLKDGWMAPHLWFPHDPYLYYMHIQIVDISGQVIDSTCERFGYREITWKGPHLYINGRELFLRGHGGHYFGDIQGSRAYIEAWLGGMKKLGINFMRLHDSPKHKELYDVADELGIMLESEAVCHFKVPENPAIWQNHLENLVKAQRNRPSIIMWSVSNELRWRGGGEKPEMIQFVKKFDTSRPVFASDFSLESRAGDICTHHYDPLTVFEDWETFGPDKPMIWDELGSVWQHDRPLCNGTSGYEVQAQDYATGLWHDGHDQVGDDIICTHDGQTFAGEYHRVNGFCPWDLSYIFFRWQPTNNNQLMELTLGDLAAPGIKHRHIRPVASPINPWDKTLPDFEPNPGYYLFSKYMQAVRFFDTSEHRTTFFASDSVTLHTRLFYEDTRFADTLVCVVESLDGQKLTETTQLVDVIPGQVLGELSLTFVMPSVASITPVRLVREFRYRGTTGYRSVQSAKVFPTSIQTEAVVYTDNNQVAAFLSDHGVTVTANKTESAVIITTETHYSSDTFCEFIKAGGAIIVLPESAGTCTVPASSIRDSFESCEGVLNSDTPLETSGGCQWFGSRSRGTLRIFQKIWDLQQDNGRLDFTEATPGAYAYAEFSTPLKHLEEGSISLSWKAECNEWQSRLETQPDLFYRAIRLAVRNDQGVWYALAEPLVITTKDNTESVNLAGRQWFQLDDLSAVLGDPLTEDEVDLVTITAAGLVMECTPSEPVEFWFSHIEWYGRAAPSARIPLNGPDHTVLKGLGQEDFSNWCGGSAQSILDLPETGNGRVILAGNKDGFGASLYETMMGKGIVLTASLNLLSHDEPVAFAMLSNLLNYGLQYDATLENRTALLAGASLSHYLLKQGLIAERFSSSTVYTALILDGSDRESMEMAEACSDAIQQMVKAGGTVLLIGTHPESLEQVKALSDHDLILTEPFLGERTHCVKAAISWTRSDTPERLTEYYDGVLIPQPFEPNYDPILSGLSNRDLQWDGVTMFEHGIALQGMDPVRVSDDYSILLSNWRIDWSQPHWGGEYIHAGKDQRRADWFVNRDAVLFRVACGQGCFLFCQLDLSAGDEKAERLTRQILTNLGCSLAQKTSFSNQNVTFDFTARNDQRKRFARHYKHLPPARRHYSGTPEHMKSTSPTTVIQKIPTKLMGDTLLTATAPYIQEKLSKTHQIIRVGKTQATSENGKGLVTALVDPKTRIFLISYGLEDLKLNDKHKPQTAIDQWAANLTSIVETLTATGAKLYWNTIVPLPRGLTGYAREQVESYNAAALSIMDLYNVYTNDLHRFVFDTMQDWLEGDTLEMTQEQLSAIGKQTAAAIEFFGAQ